MLWNLWVLRAERLDVRNLNDTSLHVTMVTWAEQRIRSGHLPFDGWFPRLALGTSFFHHYQSLPHVITAYLALAFGAATSVQWVLYLGLSFWPVAVYAGGRLFELDRWEAACAALVSPLIVSAPGYGYEHGSYTWRGLGVWTQLWGMWLLPFALPLCWRAVRRGRGHALAALVLGLNFAVHVLTGYLAFLALGVWVLVKPSQLVRRAAHALVLAVGAVLIAAWMVLPALVDSPWSANSVFNRHTVFTDSYGARKVLHWLFTGELFDFGRWPVVSILAAVGLAVSVARFRRDERSRALLGFGALSLLLFFGRPTLGRLANVLPGGGDVLLHRFIMGVDLAGIFLAGIGAAWLGRQLAGLVIGRRPDLLPAASLALPLLLVVFLLPAWRQIGRFDGVGGTWIHLQRAADASDGADVQTLLDHVALTGGGRVYAGMANGWGHTYAIYSVPVYAELLDRGVDSIGFTLRTTSLTDDVEVYFDDTNPDQYDLFNIRYVIYPVDRPAPPGATFVAASGRHRLYTMPTTGYLAVVDTVWPPIIADNATMSGEPAAFLRSPLLHERQFPPVAFAGGAAASPSLPIGSTPTGPAGEVTVQYDLPDDGVFGGVVNANRTSVVLLKATYDPRWKVIVDGKPGRTEMVAPSLIGVQVNAGTHTVRFQYQSYPHYLLLWFIGGVTLLLLVLVPRKRAFRPARVVAAVRKRSRRRLGPGLGSGPTGGPG